MIRLLFLLICCIVCRYSYGQANGKPLRYYMEAAKANSPLIKECQNQTLMQQAELERLKAMYTHSHLEATGDYLFVPIISKDEGKTAFKWNAQDGTDYYGYDLGESSGHFHAGVIWTQPLLGKNSYRVAQEQTKVNSSIANNRIRMEVHQLERTVTEHYLLCLLDKAQMDFADSISALIESQVGIVRKMVQNGFSKQSDLRLLAIEQESSEELRIASRQSYHTHLMDLNLLCGISDTTDVLLPYVKMEIRISPSDNQSSLFTEQFRLDSLNTAASLHSFNLQYNPRLDLFINGGLQAGMFKDMYRHFGWSAGLTFSWTIFDGRQRRNKERQAEWQWNTIRTYRDNAELQRQMKMKQCLAELSKYEERQKALEKQLSEYENVLSDYGKEIKAGQVSVLDYLTVLRSKVQMEKDLLLLRTNRQLVIAAYNYYNW